MCILVNAKEQVLIAKEDITVYKRLIAKGKNLDKLISPYVGTKYHIGKVKTAIKDFSNSVKRFKARTERQYNSSDLEGGIHSYTDEHIAYCKRSPEFNEEIFLAIIPKGSRYLKGINFEILSEKLIIIEKVNTYTMKKMVA